MAQTTQVTVSDTATVLSNGGCIVTLKSASAEIFIGGADVNITDKGMSYSDTDPALPIALGAKEKLYGIVAAGTATIKVLETS